mmetsp:Transcript_2772/g.4716  ORF Transcript_2772/g.4716 Transcript_2772/m.4716 type:complete len:191 (+) Transcript_2772:14-586(+)
MPPYPGTEENSWWPALCCTILSVGLVVSDPAQEILPDDFFSHAMSAGILAMAFFCMYIAVKSGCGRRLGAPKKVASHSSVAGKEDVPEMKIMRGVIKKYSEKKDWGVISVQENESDSDSDDETRVRFLRTERDRVGLQPGDPVVFRAVADPEMKGWLLAETIWRAPPDLQMRKPHTLAKRHVSHAPPTAD